MEPSMILDSAKIVYFSPTRTTEKIIKSLSQSIESSKIEFLNLTRPENRQQKVTLKQDELLIIGLPVYGGRVPNVLREWFTQLEANETPAVCLSVYGNRHYDDHMIELKEMVTKQGCKAFAHAAFIAEHSFLCQPPENYIPRPNSKDLEVAKDFGKAIQSKISLAKSINDLTDIPLIGELPTDIKDTLHEDFIFVEDSCTNCGACAQLCPVDAINQTNCTITNPEKCIACCACIKFCPRNSRVMKPSKIYQYSKMMDKLLKKPNQIELFIK